MNRDPSVLTLLDRFTLPTLDASGHPYVYSHWKEVPSWCRSAEVVFECLAFHDGSVHMELMSSMDRTTEYLAYEDDLDAVEVLQGRIDAILGRYVRVRMEAVTSTHPTMVISAYLILKTAR